MKSTNDHPDRFLRKRGLVMRISFLISITVVLIALQCFIPYKVRKTKPPVYESALFIEPPIRTTSEAKKPKQQSAVPESKKTTTIQVANKQDIKLNQTKKDLTIKSSNQNGELKKLDSMANATFNKPPEIKKEPIRRFAEIMPQFPGGMKALFQYLGNHIKYPAIERENGIEGTVNMAFVVDKDGTISDVKILSGVDRGLNNEAKRVIEEMPDWRPGRQNGKPVAVYFTLPVKFTLTK